MSEIAKVVLPSISCFESVYNSKFLRYSADKGQSHALVHFFGETALDTLAQFQVIYACDGLVHLLSRYTNKYLVRWSPDTDWISASADKPNDDRNDWGCTLFEPSWVNVNDHTKIRLKHVQRGHYARLSKTHVAAFNSCLIAESPDTDPDLTCDVFKITDWGAIHSLPTKVAFRGDNNKYLGAFLDGEGTPYLKFSYDKPDAEEVAQEVYTSPNGTVMIKSVYFGKYWSVSEDNWIVADLKHKPSSTNASALFRINVIDTNVVALLNLSNTLYCHRYTGLGNFADALISNIPSVDDSASLAVTNLS